MDAVTTRPRAGQRAGARLRARQRPSGPRCRPRLGRAGRPSRSSCRGRRRRGAGWPAASAFDVVQPHRHTARAGHLGARHRRPTRRGRCRCRAGRRAGLAGAVLRRPRRGVPASAADLLAGPWRQTLNAATMLGQSKTVLPGRDRRGLRAGRLLALQRALRPADPRRAADLRARASGTGSTTARSRASSTRSRRSTSPRSPATCRPRRR